MEWTVTLENMPRVALDFWETYKDAKVIALHGSMGAGKTTFIHALCDQKMVSSAVGSPTYSIINEYIYPGGRIYHLDLFRLQDEQEAIRAGVEDCLYSGDTCLVEWPEKAPGIFPADSLHVLIEVLDNRTRKIHT